MNRGARLVISGFGALLSLCTVQCSYAEAPPPVEAASPLLSTETSPIDSASYEIAKVQMSEAFRLEWERFQGARKAGDFSEMDKAVQGLIALRIEAGFESLEGYSLSLLRSANAMFESNSLAAAEHAAFLVRKAIQLSPLSVEVLVQSLPLVKRTEIHPLSSHLRMLYTAGIRDPKVMCGILLHSVYPVLWAGTLGLFLVFCLYFLAHLGDFIRTVAFALPMTMRGIAAPVLAFLLLAVPVFFWPLWCLFAWGVLFTLVVPHRRWLGFIAGCVLIAWGAVVPLRESLAAWMLSDGTLAAFRAYTGSFQARDADVLKSSIEHRPDDGFLAYSYGLLLRRLGYLDGSDQAFQRAERILGPQPYTAAQRGMVAFLQGENERAKKLFLEAEERGLSSPEFLFNFSKVYFELTDTAKSRSLINEAYKKNRPLVAELRAREDRLGLLSGRALAEIQLPVRYAIESAFVPMDGVRSVSDDLGFALMPGLNPLWILLPGFTLVVLFLVRGEGNSVRRLSVYYSGYKCPRGMKSIFRLFPGGGFVVGGRPAVGWCLSSVSVLLLMPLIGWPADIAALSDAVPFFTPVYGALTSLAVLGIVYCGWLIRESSDAVRRR